MGCDIHVYRESLQDGEWVASDPWMEDPDTGLLEISFRDQAYYGRNYDVFGMLCDGIRDCSYEYSFPERGLPDDLTVPVANIIDAWGSDGHSHTHVYLDEIQKLVIELLISDYGTPAAQQQLSVLQQLATSFEGIKGTNHRFVFFFDN